MLQLNDVGHSLRKGFNLTKHNIRYYLSVHKKQILKLFWHLTERAYRLISFMTDLYYDCFVCKECLSYWLIRSSHVKLILEGTYSISEMGDERKGGERTSIREGGLLV